MRPMQRQSVFIQRYILGAAPMIAAMGLLWWLAYLRHIDNPNDRLLPLPSQLLDGVLWALTPGGSGGDTTTPLLGDTAPSLLRLVVGLGLSGALALMLALAMHRSLVVRELCYPLLVVLTKVPPVALVPVL